MGGRPRTQVAGGIALTLLLAAGLGPLLHLVVQAAGVAGETAAASPFLDARSAGLLGRSLAISAGAAAIAVGLGAVCGVILARVRLRGRVWIGAGLLGGLCLSPYVLAMGWLGGRLDASWSNLLLGSPLAVSWVLGAAHLPLAALLVALGTRRLPVALEEAGLLAAGPRRTLMRIVVPGLSGICAVAGLLVFALCLADYAVASLLQVPTYPIEVFLYYAGVLEPVQAARACLPLMAVGVALALALGALMPLTVVRHWPPSPAREWTLGGRARRMAAGALAAALIVSMGIPLLVLISELPPLKDAGRALASGLGAIGNSLLVSAGSAALGLAVAWPASAAVATCSRPALIALATLLLVPQCVPASAYGIAWVEMSSVRGLPMDALGWLGPALCLAARLGGPACLFLAAARLALPAEMLEAARIQEGRSFRRGLWIAAPQLAPPAVAAAGILLALSLNAVGILVLTVPPGFEVLPLRADNLLHYGLPEEAIALAIATAVLATAPALLLVGAARLLRSGNL